MFQGKKARLVLFCVTQEPRIDWNSVVRYVLSSITAEHSVITRVHTGSRFLNETGSVILVQNCIQYGTSPPTLCNTANLSLLVPVMSLFTGAHYLCCCTNTLGGTRWLYTEPPSDCRSKSLYPVDYCTISATFMSVGYQIVFAFTSVHLLIRCYVIEMSSKPLRVIHYKYLKTQLLQDMTILLQLHFGMPLFT